MPRHVQSGHCRHGAFVCACCLGTAGFDAAVFAAVGIGSRAGAGGWGLPPRSVRRGELPVEVLDILCSVCRRCPELAVATNAPSGAAAAFADRVLAAVQVYPKARVVHTGAERSHWQLNSLVPSTKEGYIPGITASQPTPHLSCRTHLACAPLVKGTELRGPRAAERPRCVAGHQLQAANGGLPG